MSSKKASGFQNRKRKALRDQELEKQKDRLLKFFKSNPDSSDTSDLDKFVKQPDVQQNLFDHATEGISKKEENISKECVSESSMIRGECSHKIESSTTIDSADILDNCKCLEKSLTYKNNKDIDAHDLFNELQILARRLPRSMSPSDVLIYIVQQHLEDCVPNVVVSLRILLTLPVSVASGERSFSKLKLIKTYLRSTMSQNRLVDLATISIESEFASSLELKPLVDTFARRKARKAKF